jgi:hypothetical protein
MNWRHISVSLTCLTATIVFLSILVCPPVRAVTVGFGQVDWGDGFGGYDVQNSDWGQVNLSLSLSDAGLLTPDGMGGYYGYVNIVTDVIGGGLNNWAVQNMVMYYNDISEFGAGQLPTDAYFSLGQPVGMNVGSLDYRLTISPTPLLFQPSGPTTSASVSDALRVDGILTDGIVPGNLSQSQARNYIGAPPSSSALSGGRIAGSTTNVPAIAESVNACAPGSVARSLGYLSRVNPSIVITQTPQQMYASLTNLMQQQPGNGPNVFTSGNNVTASVFAAGKNMYVASNGLPVAPLAFTNTALFGGYFGGTGSAFSAAMNSLNGTNDVEVWLNWGTITNHNNSGTNFILGAHQAFVSAVRPHITSSGVVGYTVWYIDDPVQGDTNAANSLKQMTVDFNGNDLNAGPNVASAGVVGFWIETVIPEPSTFGLTVLGTAAFVFVRRRRRKR